MSRVRPLLPLLLLLVLSGVSPIFAEYVGQCSPYTQESNASCVGVYNCSFNSEVGECNEGGTGGCIAWGYNDSMKIGDCENTWWDDGCIHCDKLVCGSYLTYEYMDENGQCQNACIDNPVFVSCYDCCAS